MNSEYYLKYFLYMLFFDEILFTDIWKYSLRIIKWVFANREKDKVSWTCMHVMSEIFFGLIKTGNIKLKPACLMGKTNLSLQHGPSNKRSNHNSICSNPNLICSKHNSICLKVKAHLDQKLPLVIFPEANY